LSREAAEAIALRSLELTRTKEQLELVQEDARRQARELMALQVQVDELRQLNARLRVEREQAHAMMQTLLDYPSPVSTPPLPEDELNATTAPTAEQLAEWEHMLEVDDLRAQMDAMQTELAAMRADFDSVVSQLRNYESIDAASTRVLTELGESAVPGLVAALDHPQPEVRRWAARSLRSLGVRGQAALPSLTLALADPDPTVRDEVARAMRAIRD
jgi:hypothetical protein